MPGYNLDQLLRMARDAQDMLSDARMGDSNDAEITAGQCCADVLDLFVSFENARPNVPPPPGFSRDQVSQAANRAADMIRGDSRVFTYETSHTIAAQTLIDLVVNATLTLLDDPGLSLDDIIAENWQIDDQSCSECGDPVFVEDNGVSHHGQAGHIDYDADGDHVAIPEPASETDMVFGWLEDLN